MSDAAPDEFRPNRAMRRAAAKRYPKGHRKDVQNALYRPKPTQADGAETSLRQMGAVIVKARDLLAIGGDR